MKNCICNNKKDHITEYLITDENDIYSRCSVCKGKIFVGTIEDCL
jgi:hypothetical protein